MRVSLISILTTYLHIISLMRSTSILLVPHPTFKILMSEEKYFDRYCLRFAQD